MQLVLHGEVGEAGERRRTLQRLDRARLAWRQQVEQQKSLRVNRPISLQRRARQVVAIAVQRRGESRR